MVTLNNAVSAALAGVDALQLAQLAQLRALIDSTVYAPPGVKKVGWVDALQSVNGNGSNARPWKTLDDAVAGIGALSADADATAFAPFVLVVRRGSYAPPTKPFLHPVVIVLEEGAAVTTGSTIGATLPNRTAVTTLPAQFGVVQMGVSPTTCPAFAVSVGTGAYAPAVTYLGNGGPRGVNGLSLGAVPASTGTTAAVTTMKGCLCTTFASAGNAWVQDSTVAGAATGTNITAEGVTFGSTVTATASLVANNSTLTGNVTCPSITLDSYTASRYQSGAITCSTTPSIIDAFAQGRVQGATVASAASPQTINFATQFPVAPDAVVVNPGGAADATTFYRVSAITTTGFTIVWGGTDPTTWRYLALKSA